MGKLQALLASRELSLIVSLPANDLALAKAAIEEGADGLKVHYNVGHRASGNHFGALEEYADVFQTIRSQWQGPLGVVPAGSIEGAQAEHISRLDGLGFDFYSIYAHHLPSFMLGEIGLDRTFAIDSSYDPHLVQAARSYGMTALEASIVPGNEYGTPLSFKDVLKYRQLVELSQLPVLIPSQRKLVTEDVAVLHSTGVAAVMLGAIVLGTAEDELRRAIHAFRNAIDKIN